MTISVTRTHEIENLIKESLVKFDESGSMWVCDKAASTIIDYFKQVEDLHNKVEILLAEKNEEILKTNLNLKQVRDTNHKLVIDIHAARESIYTYQSRMFGAVTLMKKITYNIDTLTSDMNSRQSDYVEDLYDELLSIHGKAEDAISVLDGRRAKSTELEIITQTIDEIYIGMDD